MAMIPPERDLEESPVARLQGLEYEYRPNIRGRATLEAKCRERFDAPNRVKPTDGEFRRLLAGIVKSDMYEAAHSLRNWETFIRDDWHATQLHLHSRQHQGLVQEQLRSRQPAPHQHRLQPSLLQRHAPSVADPSVAFAVTNPRKERHSVTPASAAAFLGSFGSDCTTEGPFCVRSLRSYRWALVRRSVVSPSSSRRGDRSCG